MSIQKLIHIGLILSSLMGYLKWGGNNTSFLYQAEWEVLKKLVTDPLSVLHPFTILPLVGQIILAYTLFQKTPNRTLSYIGIGCLSILFIFILFIGLWIKDFAIIFSALPFCLLSFCAIYSFKKR